MTYNIDLQFRQRTVNLVKEVLKDEARFYYKNDSNFKVLHEKIFSKVSDAPFKSLEFAQKSLFRKYFYIGGAVGTPRLDVNFADSEDDQAFFFDQLHQQVKNTTFNFEKMEVLRPAFADKATEPTFDASQELLIPAAIIHPCLHALEQREIAKIKPEPVDKGKPEAATTSDNAYQGLGNKILLKNEAGKFETVVTLEQLNAISIKEASLRKDGLSGEKLVQELQAYIKKTFPGLSISLNAQCQPQAFLSGLYVDEKKNPQGLLTFKELLGEMKIREGHRVQTAAIIASKGTLGFSTLKFQVTSADGSKATIAGENLIFDQGGNGDNAVFFVQDIKGTISRVTINISDLRLKGAKDTKLNFSLYDDSNVDSPGSPKFEITADSLPELKTQLKTLYAQKGQPTDYETAPGQPKPVLLKGPTSIGPKLGSPKPPQVEDGTRTIPLTFSLTGQLSPDQTTSTDFKIPKPVSVPFIPPSPGSTGSTTSTTITTSTPKPKIPAKMPFSPPPKPQKKPVEGRSAESVSTGAYPKIPAQTATDGNTEGDNPPAKKGMKPAWKVLAITGGGTAVTVFGALGINSIK